MTELSPLNKIAEAIIENREARVQCDIELTGLHDARKSVCKALAQKPIRTDDKLRREVVSVVASIDLIIRQTNQIHHTILCEMDELKHKYAVLESTLTKEA